MIIDIQLFSIPPIQRCLSLPSRAYHPFKQSTLSGVKFKAYIREWIINTSQYLKTKQNLSYNCSYVKPCILKNISFDHGDPQFKEFVQGECVGHRTRLLPSKVMLSNLAPHLVSIWCEMCGHVLNTQTLASTQNVSIMMWVGNQCGDHGQHGALYLLWVEIMWVQVWAFPSLFMEHVINVVDILILIHIYIDFMLDQSHQIRIFNKWGLPNMCFQF